MLILLRLTLPLSLHTQSHFQCLEKKNKRNHLTISQNGAMKPEAIDASLSSFTTLAMLASRLYSATALKATEMMVGQGRETAFLLSVIKAFLSQV